MTPLLPLLFAAACCLLVGLALSGSSLARARRQRDTRDRRFADFVAPHGTVPTVGGLAPIVLVREERDTVSTYARIQRAFGISPLQRDVYPLPAWLMVLFSLGFAIGVGWLAAAVVGTAGWLLAAPGWPVVSRTLLGWFVKRRNTTLFKQFPDALAMIVRGVRVGIPVSDSVRVVAIEAPRPTALEFRRLSDELAIGVSLEDGLRQMAQRTALQEYRFFATAIALQHQAGGRLSETLETLADTIRKRVMVRARGHALAAETRMSSAVLAVLPFIAFGGLLALNPAYAMILFTDPKGHMVLASALFSLGSGLFCIRFMINRSLS